MKEITAYEATDGTIHKTRESAAMSDLIHLDHTQNEGPDCIIHEIEAEFIVQNRKKIIDILNDIDFVPEAPDYARAC
ncbi:hypothetical protein V6767_20395 [Martelella sp. FLE1502]